MTFDPKTATDEEWAAEADRRWAKRQGTPVTVGTFTAQRVAAPLQLSVITLAIPFKALVSDNEKMIPRVVRQGSRVFPRSVLNPKYKKGKLVIGTLIASQLPKDWVPWEGRCAVEATLYEPNQSRTRDPVNYAKLVNDCMTGRVFADDGQLDRSTWIRGGVDALNPRLTLTVTALQEDAR